jgi:predicted esterase
MKRILLVFSAFYLSIVASSLFAQTIPFPPEPPYNELAPWGHTNAGTGWDTSPYLPFKYQGIWFRLMPPNGVTYNRNTNTWTFNSPGTKYPLMVFSTGAGERGTDNNKQLLHGGEVHKNAVLSNRFPGFLLFWQTENGYLDSDKIQSIVNKLLTVLPIDIDRIYCEGFSRGGTVTWQFVRDLPKTWAASFPMSAASNTFYSQASVHIPVRLAQGGLDTNPEPTDGNNLYAEYQEHGGNMEYFYFPNLGHGTWNTCYALPDFYEWFLKQRKNQIHVFYGEPLVCPGDPISVQMGLTGGFDGYEWRKDGVAVGGNSNSYTATSFGSYTARFRRGSVWTEWSAPVVVGEKPPTQTPAIQPEAGRSAVIPSLDGVNSVTLVLPTGWDDYTWKNSSNTVIGTSRTISISTPGVYTANVSDEGSCSSLDSPPFTVVNANGPNGPDAVNNLRVSPVGLTSLQLTWEDNPTPTFDETGFEIYRGLSSVGPWQLIKINPANNLSYLDAGLISGTEYFYTIRAINNTAASAANEPVGAITGLDVVAPTVPGNLTVQSSTPTSVSLRWTNSTDNVSIAGYDIYVNGVKSFVSTATTSTINFTVNGLNSDQLYTFYVKARDPAGNESNPSNQVSRATTFTGLNYKYYIGDWNALPNFDALTATKLGWVSNFSLSPRTQNDYFGFVFTGKLNVTNPGSYTFALASDDGSKLFIDGVLVVNADGLHGSSPEIPGAPVNLTAGVHDIVVQQFEKTGGEGLTVRWSKAAPNGFSMQTIPASALTNVFTPPAAPTVPVWTVTPAPVVSTSFDRLTVNWAAYTGTAASIEIQRSTNNINWSTLTTVPATQTSFLNTGLNANTRYYYRLRAIGPNGESAYSASRNAVTLTLPPIPAAPSGLVLVSVNSDSDSISWNDNSNNEETFEVQKSVGTNTSFAPIANVAGSALAKGGYKDVGLFAHTTYFYRIRSRNAGGASAFSNVIEVNTTNSNPVISPLEQFALRFDEVKSFPLQASDADGDDVFFEGVNLPGFVSLFDYGNGEAELFIEPTAADLGLYEDLQINVIDGFGGVATTTFSFEVNDNHSPTIDPFAPIVLKETYLLKTAITSSDEDGDVVTWEVTNLPPFITAVPNANGDSLKLTVAPGEADAGNYTIGLKVKDASDNYSIGEFTVEIQEFNPNFKVQIDFGRSGGATGGTGWYNALVAETTVSAERTFTDISGVVGTTVIPTEIDIVMVTSWNGTATSGGVVNPYSNGPYPTGVMDSYINTGTGTTTPAPKEVKFTGLNPNNKYNFEIYGSRNSTGNRTAVYTINGTSITIDGQKNFDPVDLATFTSIKPNALGEISLFVHAPNGAIAYLNSIVITSFYDGIAPPAAPSNFAVGYNDDSDIALSWTDNASNEVGFEVFRSTDGVTFTPIATAPAKTVLAPSPVTFFDENTTPFVTYFYTVRAVNGNGNSAFTDTLSIDGLNKAPQINPVAPISVGEGQTKQVQITATDPEGGVVYLMLENAPSFITMEETAIGVATLTISPVTNDAGSYNFNIIAMDEYGYFSSSPVSLTVTDFDYVETFVYVNFTRTGTVQGSPWNNVQGAQSNTAAGLNLQNMSDVAGVPTTIDVAVNESWTGANLNGLGGLYPTNVSTSAFYYTGNNTRTITLSGLKSNQLYDLDIFASRQDDGNSRLTNYSANGGAVVSLQATGNTSNLAQLNGIHANGSGQIILTITKGGGSTAVMINALVIREYTDTGLPTTPTNLALAVLSRSSVKVNWVDQSSNETGFEVWRSVGNNSNYTLLATTAPGVQTYSDLGLAQSTTYFYKVRAKANPGTGDVFSPYTDEQSARTFTSSVSIDFGTVQGAPAPAPWVSFYNLQTTPNQTYFTPNTTNPLPLTDDLGANSGMTYFTIEPFFDDNSNGMNTGNNSGIVPDVVMQTAWYVDKNWFASFRIEGLNVTKRYNFGFLASRNGSENRTGIYTINGVSVQQNAANNTQNFVFINNIEPDANGRITVHVAPPQDGVSLAYLNAMVIQVTDGPAPAPEAAMAIAGSTEEAVNDIVVSPNPFTDHVTISVESGKEIARVALMTGNGTSVYQEMAVHQSGESHYVDFSNTVLSSGMYYMKVNFRDGSNKTVKLLRK